MTIPRRHPRPHRIGPFPLLPLALAALLCQACAGPQSHGKAAAASHPAAAPDLTLHASRRQSLYTRLNLPVITPGTQISIAPAAGPAPLDPTIITAFSARITRGAVTGPLV